LDTGGYAFKASDTNLQFTTPGVQDHWGTTSPLQTGTWMHVAATFKPGTSDGLIFYVNGVENERLTSSSMGAGSGPFLIGNNQWSETFIGLIDDVQVYDRVLTAEQVKSVFDGVVPVFGKAENPNPPTGATGVAPMVLTWQSGATAQWHEVYVGKTPELGPADKKPRQALAQTMYFQVGGFEPGATYYWRVDEVEAGTGKVYTGDVWTFTTAPLTAYNPSPRNGDRWIDPNADLSWQGGQGAYSHQLYFGTDQAAVAARDAGVSQGSLGALGFDLPTLAKETTYYWVVDEVGMANYPGQVWSFTTTAGGGGVKGEYFANTSRNIVGVPTLTRIDPEINFNWGDPGSPDASIGVDYFSARWTADLEIAVADTYTFITTSDDGARLWLGDALIVDSWIDQASTDHPSKPVKLEPGVYPLQMEYYEAIGGAVAQLSWETPSLARQIIPAGPLQPPVRARAIYPKNGDANVPQDVTLMWSTGEKAVTHDVYLGIDKAAVEAATPGDAGIYQGSQALDENTFTASALEWNTTYYWRIDEVNGAAADSPWKGSVWSFTTADFIVVDDFEVYTDADVGRIFQTWIDGWGYTTPEPGNPGNGTGATVGYIQPPFAERTIVHGGAQSMPFDYNNIIPPYYSEAERTWDSPQNWKVHGVTDLGLWLRGFPPKFVEMAPGQYTVSSTSGDVWDIVDHMRLVYKRLSGDGTIIVKVNSMTNTAAWAKAGVMIRENLNQDATHALMMVAPDGRPAFQNRGTTGGISDSAHGNPGEVTFPQWLKLERKGNLITGYHSDDGKTWTVQTNNGGGTSPNPQTIVMLGTVYIGLAVTSNNLSQPCIVQFSDVTVTGGISGAWEVADIGGNNTGNDADELYVAVQDNAGKIAVVVNPDPMAVLATDWTQWKIPLTQFTGVNLGAVKKMYIGVGDRKAPQADGAGKLFIDDIRVLKP
jgi:hypothetical protein